MVCGKHCVVLVVTLQGWWMNLQICQLNPVVLRCLFKWTSAVWIQQVECVFFQNIVTWDMTLFSLVDLYHPYWSSTSGQHVLKFKGFSSSGLYCVLRSRQCHRINGRFVCISRSFLIWVLWQLWTGQQGFGRNSFHTLILVMEFIDYSSVCLQHLPLRDAELT